MLPIGESTVASLSGLLSGERVHVVADAHHQTVAAEQPAVGLAEQEPQLTTDIIFGAEAVTAIETVLTR